jgi:tetraacyldisaccharide 4'-kinase
MKGFRHIQRPFLLPFTFLFRIVVMVRNLLFDLHILQSTSFKIPIISLGNITVGGTGKTPHVEMLVRLLAHDHKLAVLSRGYKRKSAGFVLGTRKSRVSDIGDEPVQIKTKFPEIQVAVDNHRVHGIKKLLKIKRKPDVIILDDAFQHRYVTPGLSILLVDYNRPVFHDVMLPAGNLREPWKNAKRADIIIVTKCPDHLPPNERTRFSEKLCLRPGQDLFFTAYSYASPMAVFPKKKRKHYDYSYKHLRKSRACILLVTGIANPGPILQFLEETISVQDTLFFPDHHEFNIHDLNLITKRFHAVSGAEKYILVTEKDAVRLRDLEMHDYLKKVFLYIPVEVKFLVKGEKPFYKRIDKFLRMADRDY